MKKQIEHVCLLGTGRVGKHLTRAVVNAGYQVDCLYNRTPKKVASLSEELNIPVVAYVHEIPANADLYIITTSDIYIQNIAKQIIINDKSMIVHTAGSVGMEVLKDYCQNYGVMYPLQTFSDDRELKYKSIPAFIEANSIENEALLKTFVSRVLGQTTVLNSDQRKAMHVAAVFACNFVNLMYDMGNDITRKFGMPFEVLIPLIMETASKITEKKPFDAQTGPAMRDDIKTMDMHRHVLKSFSPNYEQIYDLLSDEILKKHL